MLERDLVVQALQRAQGNQTQAAQLLGMNRDQIRYRLEKFGLDKLGRPMADERPA
jgi:DNA-binding protein Fis